VRLEIDVPVKYLTVEWQEALLPSLLVFLAFHKVRMCEIKKKHCILAYVHIPAK